MNSSGVSWQPCSFVPCLTLAPARAALTAHGAPEPLGGALRAPRGGGRASRALGGGRASRAPAKLRALRALRLHVELCGSKSTIHQSCVAENPKNKFIVRTSMQISHRCELVLSKCLIFMVANDEFTAKRSGSTVSANVMKVGYQIGTPP